MKVLLFCCKGFEMMEFASFYDVCGWAKSEYGFDIDVVICGFQKKVSSAFWKTESEQNRCAMACQGCGAVFLLFLK